MKVGPVGEALERDRLPKPPLGCHILIVDDDDRIVDALSSILARDGYQILSAATGHAALDVIRRESPDLSIIDVLLPDIDGIEVCRRIKSDPHNRFQMVVLMTGFSARARRLDGLTAGADDFLNKPIDPVELVGRVRSLLRTKQLYDEVEAHRRDLELRVAERTQELRAANQRLEELNQVKTNILAIVSHELRTPLMKVKSGLSLALEDGMDRSERDRVRRMAEAACNLLEYRIADVGVFTDPAAVTRVPVSVRDVVSGAIDQVRILQSGGGSPIDLDLPKGLPPIAVDPPAITRALAHIIDNAVKFSDSQPVAVRAHVEGEMIQIEVEDRGGGMADEVRMQIYDPLKPGDETTTRRHGGLGLGMALVKMILDAHQAPIDIYSEVGSGTTVIVRFPVARL